MLISQTDALNNSDRWIQYTNCIERVYDLNSAMKRRNLATEIVFEMQPFDTDRELPPAFNYAIALRADGATELAYLTDYISLDRLYPILCALNDFTYSIIPYR